MRRRRHRHRGELLLIGCAVAFGLGLFGAWLLDALYRSETKEPRRWVVHVVHHGSIREINDTPEEGE